MLRELEKVVKQWWSVWHLMKHVAEKNVCFVVDSSYYSTTVSVYSTPFLCLFCFLGDSDDCCVFRPALECSAHLKAVQNTFMGPFFNLFFVHFMCFQ